MNQAQERPCIGIVLSGCGPLDGTDTHEAVLTMLYLDQAGAAIVCASPDVEQLHVLNHLTHEEMPGERRVIVESARLALGDVVHLHDLSVKDLDAVILPGGHGVIKHLSDFAIKGPMSMVHPDLQRLIVGMHGGQKPIGATSVASIAVVNSLRSVHPTVTIGNDAGTASAIETMGGHHRPCKADQICADRDNRIITTPGYMVSSKISHVAAGIEKMVDSLMAMINK